MIQTQYIALALFLVLVAIGSIILLSTLIIVKRRIARRKSRIGRTTYTPCGYGLPKVWKEDIEKKINSTIKIRTEPTVFNPDYVKNFDKYLVDGEINFLYRAKTVDQFLVLKQAILSIDPNLQAPPLRNIRDFLLTARQHAMNPSASQEHIEDYCNLYLWARHDLNPYGQAEFERFNDLHLGLLELVSRTVAYFSTQPTGNSGLIMQLKSGHSSKFNTTNRITPDLKINFSSNKHSEPQTSIIESLDKSKSRIPRVKVLPKANSNSLNLKRLSYTNRRKHELLVSQSEKEIHPIIKSTLNDKVFTNEIRELSSSTVNIIETSKIPQNSHVSRRNSCQSDGSQTALIDLEPDLDVNSNTKSTIPATRPIRHGESYSQIECKSSVRYVKGMENEGVNC